jgi:hypothetical protein
MPKIEVLPISSGWITRIRQGDPSLQQDWIELSWGQTKEDAVKNAKTTLMMLWGSLPC